MTVSAAQRRFGLAHFSVLEVPPLSLVRLAADIGYASIGLRLHPAFPGSTVYELPPGSASLRELRRCLEGEGVAVYDIETVTIDAGFEPAPLLAMLEAGRELGARRLSVAGDDPDRARLTHRLAALCDLAAHFDMGIDLENMAWRSVATFRDAIAVVTAVGKPNLGVLVDALHLTRNGGTPDDVAKAPSAHIRSAQLCDAPGDVPRTVEESIAEARGGRLPPGEGTLPLRDLLAALPADVALSAEVPMGDAVPPRQRAKRIFDATRSLLASIRNHNGFSA